MVVNVTNPISDNYMSTLVQAVEGCWAAIRAQHTQVRAAIFTLGEGHKRNVYGYYRACAWSILSDKTTVDTMHLEGHTLARGGQGAFTTILHEAMHSLAFARNEKDTSRGGRYHNRIFKQLALDAGLTVEQDKRIGWVTPALGEQALTRYAQPIGDLNRAILAYMPQQPKGMGATKQSMVKLVCGCARIIRTSKKVYDGGAIICNVCRDPFGLDE